MELLENNPTEFERQDADGTERAYWACVRLIAKEIVEECDEGEESDRIHESVDGCNWVFTYWRARKVLLYSPNEDAIFDVMGKDALAGVDSMQAAYVAAAFWAMRADVEAELADARAEHELNKPEGEGEA